MFKSHRLLLAVLALCALSLYVPQVRADDGDSEGDQGDQDNWGDCGDHHHHDRFRGCINLDQGLVLTATSNAPAGAKGKAEFIFVNDNGTNYEMLFVKTIGLTDSVYTVELTDNTGTNTFNLGTLNVVTRTNFDFGCHFTSHCPPWGGGTNAPSMGWTKWVSDNARKEARWMKLMRLGACTNLATFATNAYCWHTNTLTVGSGSFLLPDGISQSNATVVTVSDSNNIVALTGDFSTTTNSTIIYKEIADIVPGTATNAQGAATITYRLRNGKALGTFKLQATGLPANEKLFLTADSTNTCKVYTGNQGTLNVRSFRHLDVSTIQDIVATDTSSNVVFTVHF
jgi:hypothetical protein